VSQNSDLEKRLQGVRALLAQRHTGKWDSALSELLDIDKPLLIDALTRLLSDNDSGIRVSVAEAFLRIDPEVGMLLVVSLLKDPRDHVRWYVCGLLHDFGDSRATEYLIELVQTDPDADVRYVACYALSELGDRRSLEVLWRVQQNDLGTDYEGRRISEMAEEAIQRINAREDNAR
jgi:HEAT repeat protein